MIDDWPTRDLITHRVATTPDRTAVIDGDTGRTRTYRAFDGDVGRTATCLRDLGVQRGDSVGVLLSGGLEFARLIHAAFRVGVVLVPLNVRLSTDRLHEQANRADLEFVVTDRDHEPVASDLRGDTVVAGRLSSADAGDVGGGGGAFEPVERSPDDDVLVLFTSGTTGDPKGVRLTVGNLVASATASAFRLGLSPADRWLTPLPMYHMGGLAPVVRSALYGSAVVLQDGFDVDRATATMERYDVTGVSLVPTALSRLLDGEWSPPDSLRFVLLGGAPADESLVERCRDRDVPVHPTYGLTETASQVATARPREAFEHEGTVGQPLVTTDVTVVGEDGAACDVGDRGEVVVDGPTVTPGYLDDETTANAFGEHGLHTGDVGYRDGDGRLWVVGRIDDRIVTGGENVHPARVEAAIADHPDVTEVAVVGLHDPDWGQRVSALVVAPDDPGVTALETHCRERLADYEVPKTWGFADHLPRTPSGTVDREAVRDLLSKDESGGGPTGGE